MKNEQITAKKIIENAKKEAEKIIELARAKVEIRLSEAEILKAIKKEAVKIKKELTEECETIRKSENKLLLTKYCQTQKLYDNRWMVQKQPGYKVGVIDKFGTNIIPYEYDNISLLSGDFTLFLIQQNKLFGLCDLDGFVLIEPTYKYIGEFKNSKSAVEDKAGNRYYINIYNKKVGKNPDDKDYLQWVK